MILYPYCLYPISTVPSPLRAIIIYTAPGRLIARINFSSGVELEEECFFLGLSLSFVCRHDVSELCLSIGKKGLK